MIQRKVTIIPADPAMMSRDIRKKHLRVAPYCRVSTDSEKQLSSYEAQIEYYTAKIAENPDWTMVRLYADEGITGTSTRKRKEFLRMIRDCEKGQIWSLPKRSPGSAGIHWMVWIMSAASSDWVWGSSLRRKM